VNSAIFREYDIRGLIATDLTREHVARLGQALGTFYQDQGCAKIVLGRDCRLSSPDIAATMAQALLSCGCQVIDIGVCHTPALYFALRHFQADGGVMVTASHNPPEFNGFKICRGWQTIFGAEIQKLREMAQAGHFVSGHGSIECQEILPCYLDYLKKNLQVSRPLKVGVDGGHGTAGPVAVALFRELGCEVHPLYCEMDGNFPAHLPDPTVPAHLQDLQHLIAQNSLDVGVAFDGDGDRLGVVGPQGEIIWGDELLIAFARDILRQHPRATIIGEVKCSQKLYDDIARHGGRPLMWKTGHSLIKKKMLTEQALLAGEMSGHFFFADRYFGYDDAIYAAGRLFELMANSQQSITTMLADLPVTVTTPEIRRDCPDEVKFQVVEGLKARVRGKFPFNELDGLRIQFSDGWGLVRASNTQPALVLRFEAPTAQRLTELQHIVQDFLTAELASHGVC
jgi:phosphomannomutase / phosphoglucomutase